MSVDGSVAVLRPARWREQGASSSVVYGAALTICLTLSVVSLTLGALVALKNSIPSIGILLAAAQPTGTWAGALLKLADSATPSPQLFLDYAFSCGALVLAGVLLVVRDRTWPVRLTALALVASASAFNLETHAAVHAVSSTGLPLADPLFATVLPVVVCGSFLLALAVLPSGNAGDAGPSRTALLVVGAGSLLLIIAATIVLAMPYCASLLLGAVVPVVGSTVLRAQMLRAPVVEMRTQSRQLFTIMVGAFAVATVLALVTLVLQLDGWDGQNLVDPTTGVGGPGDPIALQFWYSRLICTAIAGALLVTTRRGGSYSAERLFSRGLIAAAVAVLVAGGYVIVHSLTEDTLHGKTALGAVELVLLGGVPMALLLLPAYVATERLVDWLLYGSRPTPYNVLARVAALAESPDLARLAEGLGQDLGASTCRLTVYCPTLRNSVYNWAGQGVDARPDVDIPVLQGAEQVGTIAVDQGTVATLQGQRSHLLEAVADSLGAVFRLHRTEIELRHRLKSATTYAGQVAASRRAMVTEMASDRRRTERDLHEGADHQLHSIRTTLGLAEQAVSAGRPDEARAFLTQVAGQVDAIDGLLTESATRVSAPLLFELGLVRALGQELAVDGGGVRLDADGLDESTETPSPAAAAVYFCCLEAVGNARRQSPGAAIDVRLATVAGHLHFSVHDAGPVQDKPTARQPAGRGMHSLDARVATVGGWVDVRSAPGAGTVVEGAVPLGPRGSGRTPEPGGLTEGAVPPLIDQVRDLLRQARTLYREAPAAAALGQLLDRLDSPVRISLCGPPGSGISTLVEALRAAFQPADAGSGPTMYFSEAAAVPPLIGEGAPIVLLSYDGTDEIPPDDPLGRQLALTIGVLTRIDEMGAIDPTGAGMTVARHMAAVIANSPDMRWRCSVVIPVAGQLALAAASLNDGDLDVLRTIARRSGPVPDRIAPLRPTPRRREQPMGGITEDTAGADVSAETENWLRRRLGAAGVGVAVALIRTGEAPTAAALAAALTRSSGMQGLVEQLNRRLIRRALSMRARGAFLSLQELVSVQPPPREANRLRRLISALRVQCHELAELDTVADLYSTRDDLPADLRAAAARLLGAAGPEPHVRLSVPDDAGPEAIAAAAAAKESYWRELSSRTTTRQSWGDLGAVVVRTCEHLRSAGF